MVWPARLVPCGVSCRPRTAACLCSRGLTSMLVPIYMIVQLSARVSTHMSAHRSSVCRRRRLGLKSWMCCCEPGDNCRTKSRSAQPVRSSSSSCRGLLILFPQSSRPILRSRAATRTGTRRGRCCLRWPEQSFFFFGACRRRTSRATTDPREAPKEVFDEMHLEVASDRPRPSALDVGALRDICEKKIRAR